MVVVAWSMNLFSIEQIMFYFKQNSRCTGETVQITQHPSVIVDAGSPVIHSYFAWKECQSIGSDDEFQPRRLFKEDHFELLASSKQNRTI